MLRLPFGSSRSLAVAGLLLTPVVVLCIYFVDVPVASFVQDSLYSKASWSAMTSELPDLLSMVVLASMAASLLVYLLRSRKGVYDRTTDLAKLVLWVAPSSFVVKTLLKILFGRVNTRRWVQEPELYGFYWLQMRRGFEGFPSGHMLVMVALLAAWWRFYPASRPVCLIALVSLGVALIATNYHFVSDVIAGAFLGVLVEAGAFRLLFSGGSERAGSKPR